jgi:linoleoyl-CoA desaturase
MRASTAARVRFPERSAFREELNRRVEADLAARGGVRSGGRALWLKTAVLFVWLAASYALLIAHPAWWQAVLAAISLGLAMAGIGFSVGHDANHGSYSGDGRVNRVMGAAFDLLGGSSFFWKQRHNVLHHSYTNISGFDLDIDGNALLRFAPHTPRRPWHRYQHLYVWILYGLYPWGWWFIDDFHRLVTGRIGEHTMPRPRAPDLALFWGGKAGFLTWGIVVPALVYRSPVVIPFMLLAVAVLGMSLAIVFQLAHCLGEADFHDGADDSSLSSDWAVHQVTTTVDFARHNRLLGWYLGGLNFQIEHHLFSRISHVHYRALAPIVEETCRRHGVRYRAHPSLLAAIGANVRWLRRMGST